MRCPLINELPPPPYGKTGWPWTISSTHIPPQQPGGRPWPRLSIVTPSFNQQPFIEETIRSVLLQGYPDLEYIIIDGGSTDGSIQIIKKYARWLHYWVTDADNGQSNAINKGFNKATGSLYGYINSDDLYEQDALANIASQFRENISLDLVAGICTVFDEGGVKRLFEPSWPDDISSFVRTTFSSTFGQPASFWTADLYRKIGGFDESLSHCFDRDFFLKAGLSGVIPLMIPVRIARFREHPLSKSFKNVIEFHKESILLLSKHGPACGLSSMEIKEYGQIMRNEVAYEQIFSIWRDKGRSRAMLSFLRMILESPQLLLQRKILGQMRRLLFFSSRDVAELS